jgi:Ni/Fe-hydrogenase subunit HybB-like protein
MQKKSTTPSARQVIIHSAMGTILGALLGISLILTNQLISQLIASSSSPSISLAVFIGFFSFVVGTGATISGFIFSAIELNALEAKQQTERVSRRRGPRT